MRLRRLELERLVAERRALVALLALALFSIVALMWLWVSSAGALPGDRALAAWAQRRPPSERFNDVDFFFGGWAAGPIAIGVTALGAAVTARRSGPRYGALVVAAALAAPLNELVAAILGPPPLAAAFFRGQSVFPSGHAAFACAMGGVLALLAWSRGLWEAALIVAGVAFATGVSRVFSGAHALSDVLAGYALGAGWLLVVLAIGVPAPAGGAASPAPR
ncbi:MAG: superfamily [Solirubrobacteraceae bacterium]|jgi:undecaprenyl-diphosphatase|nr:superfamily [Solirubrobacteraceae bacterium]